MSNGAGVTRKIATSKGIFEIQIPISGSGEYALICPACTPGRKPEHQKEKKLSVNIGKDPMPWRCNHCDESGYVLTDTFLAKEMIKPLMRNYDYIPLSDPIVQWFWEKRKIGKQTLNHFDISSSMESLMQQRVSTENLANQGKFVTRRCINFKYKKENILVNIKFRDPNKNFKMIPGASLIPYNIDSIKGQEECIITEGEIDVMSYWEAGSRIGMISVPNGVAMTEAEKSHFQKTGKVRVISNINLEYLDIVMDDLEHIKMFYIATDDDGPGIKLREELARRLGYERCKYIKFGDYKDEEGQSINDPNELLVERGKTILTGTLDNASPFPISGVFSTDKYYDQIIQDYRGGKEKGISSGYACLDPFFNWMKGWLYVINGFPNMGKTSVALNLMVIAAVLYKWKFGIYCPENYPAKNVIEILSSIALGKAFDPGYERRMTEDEFAAVHNNFIKKHFFIIDNEDGFSPKKLREIKIRMVKQHGIVGFLTDPWSALNHDYGRWGNVDDYLQDELNNEVRLTTKYNLINIICHHPKTPKSKADAEIPPSTWELTGGQRWWSKAYSIVTVHQEKSDNWSNTRIGFHVQKMKDKQAAGETTTMNNYPILKYDMLTRRLYERESIEKENSKFVRFPFISYLEGDQSSLFDGF